MLVEIQLYSPELHTPIELKGTVVSHTTTGFAIEFLNTKPEILKRVGALS